LLGPPAVERIATLPRQNRSDNDMHGSSFRMCRGATDLPITGVIICQIAKRACEQAHTTRIYILW
jgi:hypothetical protein